MLELDQDERGSGDVADFPGAEHHPLQGAPPPGHQREATFALVAQRALSGSTMRSQVLCLTAYLDRGTASRAAYLLAALSQACHYHPYELAPTAAELLGWLDETAQIVTRMEEAGAAPVSAER